MNDSLENLKNKIANVCAERNWGNYHSPKNIAILLSLESSEMLEIYKWKTEEESRTINAEELQCVKDEAGDILFNLLNLCSKHGIDLVSCCNDKIVGIESKYPVVVK